MFTERSYCGELTRDDAGKRVTISGWVDRKRDLGGVIFIELRDVSGILQAVFDSSDSKENADKADTVRSEYVVTISGVIRKRTEETVNPNVKTGDIEVVADSIEILNTALTPPFPVETRDTLSEEIRLKYRYIDLRREEMQESIIKRHLFTRAVREYLSDNRFIEIETPMLNKSTPEGARDFLVPSRVNPGEFYALPQSPQLFKQILMISGFDRYFQIVRCFRDEDLRNDRQPEFTQVDLELSFVTPDMIISIIEGLLKEALRKTSEVEIETPFPRMTYDEAMKRYGKDAPDTRFGLELSDCTDIFSDSDFKVFSSALENGGIIKGFAVNDGGRISRKMSDDYTEYVKIYGAGGFPMVRYTSGAFEGGISKFIKDDEKTKIIERFELKEDAIIFFSVDKEEIVNHTLGNMRIKIASDLGMIDESKFNFVWVTDFPLFEYSPDDERFYAKHHPFTSPHPEDIHLLKEYSHENFSKIRALAYDVVLNGVEIGGGSIRINQPEIQEQMLKALGISEEEASEKFSFLIDALKYGAPPHGGIALGLDRIMMLILNKNSIRDVIPFPKTQKGQCLMSNAPSGVDDKQLKELSLKVVER